MRQDTVARIEIDADGQLHVVPTVTPFPYIWREAMEVHWDPERRSLYGPPPRKWSRARWLRQILAAAKEQGCNLLVTDTTEWVGIEPETKAEMLREVGPSDGAR